MCIDLYACFLSLTTPKTIPRLRQKQSKTKAVLITENLKEYSCFQHHIIMLNLVHHHFQAFPKGPSQSLPDQQLLHQALGRQGLSPSLVALGESTFNRKKHHHRTEFVSNSKLFKNAEIT